MPRSGRVEKRTLLPDPIYNSRLVSRLINRVMKSGKKSLAQRLVYKVLSEVESKSSKSCVMVLETAVSYVSPKMEVRPRRIGGASYQIPVEVRGDRREALALRWLIEAAQKRSNKEYHTFDAKLAAELLEAAEGRGTAVKKKEDTHRAAEANRAFAHFRW